MTELKDLDITGFVVYDSPLKYKDKIEKFTGMSVLENNIGSESDLDSDMSVSPNKTPSDSESPSDSDSDSIKSPVKSLKVNLASSASPLEAYLCMGEIKLGEGFASNTFRIWKKNGEYFMEILYDCNPDYFVPLNKLDLRKSINENIKKYNVEDDVGGIGSAPLLKIMAQAQVRSETYSSSLEGNNYKVFYMGLLDDVGAFENSMVFNRLTMDTPVKLSTAHYTDPNEYPTISVFKTKFSKSFIEFYVFTRYNINDHYPLLCRCIYEGKAVPVDVQCFIKNHLNKELGEYLTYVEEVYCEEDDNFLPLMFELYLTLDGGKLKQFLDYVQPRTDKVKHYFEIMRKTYAKLEEKIKATETTEEKAANDAEEKAVR